MNRGMSPMRLAAIGLPYHIASVQKIGQAIPHCSGTATTLARARSA